MVSSTLIGKPGGSAADEQTTNKDAVKSRPQPAPHNIAQHTARPDAARGFLSRWSERKRSDTIQAPVAADSSDPDSGDNGSGNTDLADADVNEIDLPANEPGSQSDPQLQGGQDAAQELQPSQAGVAQDATDTDSSLTVDDAAEPSQPLLTDLDMPDLATLDASSDFSPFMNEGVSKELRQKALRHLFRLPKFNVRDGLNDYDEDYTYFEPLGDTVTCDMKFHTARKERERLEKLELERLELEEAQKHAELEGEQRPGIADADNVDDELSSDTDNQQSGDAEEHSEEKSAAKELSPDADQEFADPELADQDLLGNVEDSHCTDEENTSEADAKNCVQLVSAAAENTSADGTDSRWSSDRHETEDPVSTAPDIAVRAALEKPIPQS